SKYCLRVDLAIHVRVAEEPEVLAQILNPLFTEGHFHVVCERVPYLSERLTVSVFRIADETERYRRQNAGRESAEWGEWAIEQFFHRLMANEEQLNQPAK